MTATTAPTTIDPTPPTADDEQAVQLNMGQLVGELANAGFVSMVAIGDRLGLYAALHELGGATVGDLSAATSCHERLVFEWLCSNAAAGYLEHDPLEGTFTLRPGAAAVLADASSPAFLAPAASVIRSYYSDQDHLEAAFRGNGGIEWGAHHECMFSGVERFFATAYTANLVSSWIPSVPGLERKLLDGAEVADVGCGHGVSTALLAGHYPGSQFHGVDFHVPSIERAGLVAGTQGVEANTSFEVATSTDFTGGPFDVICFFDALHDMGDPEGALRHARTQLADDGIVLLVEMYAGSDLTETLQHPLAPWFFAASTALCTPSALAQRGPMALGNQAGPARFEELFRDNGFSQFRVALETPFNLVMEARP